MPRASEWRQFKRAERAHLFAGIENDLFAACFSDHQRGVQLVETQIARIEDSSIAVHYLCRISGKPAARSMAR